MRILKYFLSIRIKTSFLLHSSSLLNFLRDLKNLIGGLILMWWMSLIWQVSGSQMNLKDSVISSSRKKPLCTEMKSYQSGKKFLKSCHFIQTFLGVQIKNCSCECIILPARGVLAGHSPQLWWFPLRTSSTINHVIHNMRYIQGSCTLLKHQLTVKGTKPQKGSQLTILSCTVKMI